MIIRQPPSIRELVKLGPEVVERMALEGRPEESTVASYVMTGGAERAWQALNRHLGQSTSAIFWIGGAEGAGKTHFLNYVLALDRNAGAISADAGQRLTIALAVAAPARAEDLETQVIETLARELAGNHWIALPWRLMRGAAGAHG
ncbi:MAG: hypothetical protein WA005_18520, partial [Candidatus Binataceae bacterium]